MQISMNDLAGSREVLLCSKSVITTYIAYLFRAMDFKNYVLGTMFYRYISENLLTI
jgi:hypothetical protein